jgi:hypothetical protein
MASDTAEDAPDPATVDAGERTRRSPPLALARGVGAGVACYLATYATVGGLFALDFTANVARGDGGGGLVRAVQHLGWVVYNAHFVRTDAWLALNFIELSAEPLVLPAAVYYAIPVAVLTGGGWAVARRAPAGARRVVAGASVVAGYLPAVAVGALAVTTPEGGPELVPAVLLAGVAYPVAFGTVGGLLADRG